MEKLPKNLVIKWTLCHFFRTCSALLHCKAAIAAVIHHVPHLDRTASMLWTISWAANIASCHVPSWGLKEMIAASRCLTFSRKKLSWFDSSGISNHSFFSAGTTSKVEWNLPDHQRVEGICCNVAFFSNVAFFPTARKAKRDKNYESKGSSLGRRRSSLLALLCGKRVVPHLPGEGC